MQVFKSILAKEINGKKVSVYPRTSDDMVYLSDNITTLNNKLNEFESRISQIENPIITNKPTLKIQIFGDSISDPSLDRDIWVNHIQEFIPNYDFDIKNCANAGSGIGWGSHSSGNMYNKGYTLNNVYNLVTANEINSKLLRTDNDFIIIFIGTNNYGNQNVVNFGAFGDLMQTKDDQTFYGAMRAIIKYIFNNEEAGGKCTTSKLIFCTIPYRYRTTNCTYQDYLDYNTGVLKNYSGDKTLQDYNKAIIECCNAYGATYVDLYKNLCWNSFNVSEYTIDGLHPNALGSQQIAKLITNKIKEYL